MKQFGSSRKKGTVSRVLTELHTTAIESPRVTNSRVPVTAEEWGKIKDTFFHRWNFPMCCGTINGEHVIIKRPPGAKDSDSAIFRDSTLYIELENNKFGMPEKYIIIGDDAFPLRTNLLKLYSKTGLNNYEIIFNCRLSPRRFVECAFGVLSNKWRVLHTSLLVEPDFSNDIIKACCILHKFIRKRDGYNFEGPAVQSQGIEVRDYYSEYFMRPESVTFQ
ncbi:Harbinger transposase-derived nuclease domain, partial [Cinara cedri]